MASTSDKPTRAGAPSRPDLPVNQAAPGELGVLARHRLYVAIPVGIAAGFAAAAVAPWDVAALVGWDLAATVLIVWIWLGIARLDAERTAQRAVREDPSVAWTNVLLLSASVASLGGVGLVFLRAGGNGAAQDGRVALAVGSVLLSWTLVHTVFALRYARLYYTGPDGGINFNQQDAPDYVDFAYLAFTLGMTFQVSDTDLESSHIRHTALRHALLSYLFGAVIVAGTINLVAGLTK